METPLVPTDLQAPPRRSDVPLAPLTTLELGGAARWLVEASSEEEVLEALAWARRTGTPVAVLGGGSNVVVADAGFDGLVVRVALRGVSSSCAGPGEPVLVTAAAGEGWDDLVARAVAEGWAGVECLSGIPGTVGATPVQNVGAYGQEVADTIVSVRVLDTGSSERPSGGSLREPPQGCGAPVASGDAERATVGVVREMAAAECGFGYRDSVFRRSPGRFVVLAATFALRPGGPAEVRYAESPGPSATRRARPRSAPCARPCSPCAARSPWWSNPADPNRRSVGCVLRQPGGQRGRGRRRGCAAPWRAGAASDAAAAPRHGAGTGRVKLSAAWLIERAGFPRHAPRQRRDLDAPHTRAGAPRRRHRGQAVALAREVQCGVDARFGVLLRPEPVFLGYSDADPVTGRCGTRTRCR